MSPSEENMSLPPECSPLWLRFPWEALPTSKSLTTESQNGALAILGSGSQQTVGRALVSQCYLYWFPLPASPQPRSAPGASRLQAAASRQKSLFPQGSRGPGMGFALRSILEG